MNVLLIFSTRFYGNNVLLVATAAYRPDIGRLLLLGKKFKAFSGIINQS